MKANGTHLVWTKYKKPDSPRTPRDKKLKDVSQHIEDDHCVGYVTGMYVYNANCLTSTINADYDKEFEYYPEQPG